MARRSASGNSEVNPVESARGSIGKTSTPVYTDEVFAASSYENLRTDISRGSGEYLVSLATLAGVPSYQFVEFQSMMQSSYSTMFDDVVPAQESTKQVVEIAWSNGHGRIR